MLRDEHIFVYMKVTFVNYSKHELDFFKIELSNIIRKLTLPNGRWCASRLFPLTVLSEYMTVENGSNLERFKRSRINRLIHFG